MLYSTISQIVTLLAVGLALVWHQQRSIDRLRKEFQRGQRLLRKEFQRGQRLLRKEFQRGRRSLRKELRRDHAELKLVVETNYTYLSQAVGSNGQRLARIEGFLGIAMLPEAAAKAPGVAYAGPVAEAVDTPASDDEEPAAEVGGSDPGHDGHAVP